MAIDVTQLTALAAALEAAEQDLKDIRATKADVQTRLENLTRKESQASARILKAKDELIRLVTGGVQ